MIPVHHILPRGGLFNVLNSQSNCYLITWSPNLIMLYLQDRTRYTYVAVANTSRNNFHTKSTRDNAMNSQTMVMMSLSILVSVAITASCAILLFGFYRSQKRKRSNVAVTTLVFSNGLYGAIALPIWIYLMYRTGPLHPLPKKLYIAYMVIDITLTVATTLQLLFISYEQLRIKMRPTFHFTGI